MHTPREPKPSPHSPGLNQPPRLLTIDETCEQLRVSRYLVYRLIRRRELETIKVGRRRLVPVSAIDALLAHLAGETSV